MELDAISKHSGFFQALFCLRNAVLRNIYSCIHCWSDVKCTTVGPLFFFQIVKTSSEWYAHGVSVWVSYRILVIVLSNVRKKKCHSELKDCQFSSKMSPFRIPPRRLCLWTRHFTLIILSLKDDITVDVLVANASGTFSCKLSRPVTSAYGNFRDMGWDVAISWQL